MRPANAEEDAAVAEAVPARPASLLVPVPVPIPEAAPTIYISEKDQQSGPFTRAQVRATVVAGSVSEEAYYWREGRADWQGVWSLQ